MIEIELTQGQVAFVSDEDEHSIGTGWYAGFNPAYAGGGRYRVIRTVYKNGKQYTEYLHRVIMSLMLGRELRPGEVVDHIDGNPLNNQRDNLRLATFSQNAANRQKQSNNQSGYKGVSLDKRCNKWRAMLYHKGKHIFLGQYNTREEAAEAYRRAAREYFGEFAKW